MENNEKGNKVENGVRMSFSLICKAKINIYDQKEIETLKEAEILEQLDKFCREFDKKTGSLPTLISLSSDLSYLARQAIQKETGEYQSSDKAVWKNIKIRSGCSVGDNEVVLSAWKEVRSKEQKEIIEA
jgi:hypothetical protein